MIIWTPELLWLGRQNLRLSIHSITAQILIWSRMFILLFISVVTKHMRWENFRCTVTVLVHHSQMSVLFLFSQILWRLAYTSHWDLVRLPFDTLICSHFDRRYNVSFSGCRDPCQSFNGLSWTDSSARLDSHHLLLVIKNCTVQLGRSPPSVHICRCSSNLPLIRRDISISRYHHRLLLFDLISRICKWIRVTRQSFSILSVGSCMLIGSILLVGQWFSIFGKLS